MNALSVRPRRRPAGAGDPRRSTEGRSGRSARDGELAELTVLGITPAADRAFGEGAGVGAADGESGGALDAGDGGEPGAVEAGDGAGPEEGAAADEGVDALEG